MSNESAPTSTLQKDGPTQSSLGHITQGLNVDLEGFQALASIADDGRVDVNLHKKDKSCATVERLLQHMARQEDSYYEDQRPESDIDISKNPPPLNIVIQIVGSRGDVQPFVALGLELQKFGHRVRIATHPPFREFVLNAGLEYFSIGGDPEEMMAYMVKNPGLLPHMKSLHDGDVAKSRTGIREILEGCWKSCFETAESVDSSNGGHAADLKPFVANAIIANPPSFAHIHCAEKLGVPLHMMFTYGFDQSLNFRDPNVDNKVYSMPWSPTRTFPHPLANIESCSVNARAANYFSFMLAETLMWLGLGDLINSFRTETLGLMPIDIISAPAAVPKLQIPFTYCWSPALIPKPADWGPLISICGNYNLQSPVSYTPPNDLVEFLGSGSCPIYIGFGSIVLDDPGKVTRILLKAIQQAGTRAIISKGWAHLGRDVPHSPTDVIFIDNCPHDWIFRRVSCIVHHGGAGTTAAAVAAGKPSIIIPFFGDQSFWGKMVSMAGAGPTPIPFKELSVDRLAEAIRISLTSNVLKSAHELGTKVAKEDGVKNGVQAFHNQLARYNLQCSIFPCRAATWRLKGTDTTLCSYAASVLVAERALDRKNIQPIRICEYDLNYGALDPITGTVGVALDSAVQLLQSVKEIKTSLPGLFTKSRRSSDADPDHVNSTGLRGGLKSAGKVPSTLLQSPINTGVAITQGLHNVPRFWGGQVRRKQPCVTDIGGGLKAGTSGLAFGIYDGVSGIFLEPYHRSVNDGAVGAISGLGIGLLSCMTNVASGLTGAVAYPLKGVDASITQSAVSSNKTPIECALIAEGDFEASQVSREERNSIVRSWRTEIEVTRPKKISRGRSKHR